MAKLGIMAYGTQLDRDKLAVLASVENEVLVPVDLGED